MCNTAVFSRASKRLYEDFKVAKRSFNPNLFYICSLSGVILVWVAGKTKNHFALTEMQSDRNATKDHIKSYEVTKYQGLIKKIA